MGRIRAVFEPLVKKMVKRREQVLVVTATIVIASMLAYTITYSYAGGTELDEYTYSQV